MPTSPNALVETTRDEVVLTSTGASGQSDVSGYIAARKVQPTPIHFECFSAFGVLIETRPHNDTVTILINTLSPQRSVALKQQALRQAFLVEGLHPAVLGDRGMVKPPTIGELPGWRKCLFFWQTGGVQHGILAPRQVLQTPQRIEWKLTTISRVMPPYVTSPHTRKTGQYNYV